MGLSDVFPSVGIAVPQDKEEILNGFVDDRTFHTTINDIEKRIDSVFKKVPKYSPESGDRAIANFVWETTTPYRTVTINPEKEDGVVELNVHMRKDSAAVGVIYPLGYRGSCAFIGSRTNVLEAVRKIADWKKDTSMDG